jgi:AbrB family looped-hinge helix DNA binding protein
VIMDTFRRLGRTMDITIIIVTHDPRIASQVDRVVAIRDGKISTETVRQTKAPTEQDMLIEQGHKEAVSYQEFVVLDSAGRLQIPKEIREQMGIGNRVEMEIEDGRIVLRPVVKEGEKPVRGLTLEEQIAILFEQDNGPQDKNASRARLFRKGVRK